MLVVQSIERYDMGIASCSTYGGFYVFCFNLKLQMFFFGIYLQLWRVKIIISLLLQSTLVISLKGLIKIITQACVFKALFSRH